MSLSKYTDLWVANALVIGFVDQRPPFIDQRPNRPLVANEWPNAALVTMLSVRAVRRSRLVKSEVPLLSQERHFVALLFSCATARIRLIPA